jgi:DNA-binding GntR family transcriptional regulator
LDELAIRTAVPKLNSNDLEIMTRINKEFADAVKRNEIHRILYRKYSTLYGGENTIDHHAELVRILATGDADAAAKLSAAHWVQLGDLIGDLFAKEQLDT